MMIGKSALAVAILIVSTMGAGAKEIKDLSDEEKGQVGRMSRILCQSDPGKYYNSFDTQTNIKYIMDENLTNKLRAFLNILVDRYGMKTACNMLYIDDIITAPGSKPQ